MIKTQNTKKAFTLAELMVVIAIIGMLTAAAITIFGGAQSAARDSRRISDLNTIASALEIYHIKNNYYPQPAKRTLSNVWGYVKNQSAKATCSITFKTNPDGNGISSEINYKDINCGGNIEIEKAKLTSLECKFDYLDSTGAPHDNETQTISGDYTEDYIFGDWKTYKDACENYFYDTSVNQQYVGAELQSPITYVKGTDAPGAKIPSIVGWKGTLTSLSGKNSIHHSDEEKISGLFNSYLKEQTFDPKYNSGTKYKDYGVGFYPYAVFRDNIGTNNNNPKANVGGTAYQISATLEKQDDDGNFHPETLIIGNYKPITNDYPASLIGNGKQDVIINGQKYMQRAGRIKKGRRPSKPDRTKGNMGIPYAVEEIQ